MAIPEGLRTSLNAIRETSIQDNTLYANELIDISNDIITYDLINEIKNKKSE